MSVFNNYCPLTSDRKLECSRGAHHRFLYGGHNKQSLQCCIILAMLYMANTSFRSFRTLSVLIGAHNKRDPLKQPRWDRPLTFLGLSKANHFPTHLLRFLRFAPQVETHFVYCLHSLSRFDLVEQHLSSSSTPSSSSRFSLACSTWLYFFVPIILLDCNQSYSRKRSLTFTWCHLIQLGSAFAKCSRE